MFLTRLKLEIKSLARLDAQKFPDPSQPKLKMVFRKLVSIIGLRSNGGCFDSKIGRGRNVSLARCRCGRAIGRNVAFRHLHFFSPAHLGWRFESLQLILNLIFIIL